jgi:carbamoyl-phosphate synthase large subunit
MRNVLVTATSGTNVGTQILEALLLLPESYRLVATDTSDPFFGAFKAHASFVVPPASAPNYLDEVLDICQSEKVEIIIPGSEAELAYLSKHQQVLQDASLHLLINNSEVINTCLNKMDTCAFLKKNGFAYAPFELVSIDNDPAEEADRLLDVLRLPVVVKPYMEAGGSKGIHVIQEDEELVALLKIFHGSKTNLMAQEYVGSAEEEYTIGVLSDDQGRAFSSFVLKRIINSTFTRMIHVVNRNKSRIKTDYLTISTGVSQGWVDDFPEMRSFAEELANALGSTGPLNIQCRRTEQGIVTFEINPRFSGTTSIRAICGHNDPDLMIRGRFDGQWSAPESYAKGLVLRGLENLFVPGQAPE